MLSNIWGGRRLQRWRTCRLLWSTHAKIFRYTSSTIAKELLSLSESVHDGNSVGNLRLDDMHVFAGTQFEEASRGRDPAISSHLKANTSVSVYSRAFEQLGSQIPGVLSASVNPMTAQMTHVCIQAWHET